MHFERHELHGNLMKGYHSGSLAVEPTPDTSGTVRFLVMTVRNNNKPAAIGFVQPTKGVGTGVQGPR